MKELYTGLAIMFSLIGVGICLFLIATGKALYDSGMSWKHFFKGKK